MATKTELKLAEVIGYLKSITEKPAGYGRLCNFFKDLPYDANKPFCKGCILYIDGKCFLGSYAVIANKILDEMERKNKFKLDYAYKNGVVKYE